MGSLVKSVYKTDRDIISSIRSLYLGGDNFDVDPCYSTGAFYRDLERPECRLDRKPTIDGVYQNDIVIDGLPISNESIMGGGHF